MFLRTSRPLMAKRTENVREVLIGLYSQMLNEIKKVPEDVTYRGIFEKHTNHKLKACQLEEDVESIPTRIYDCHFPVEELIDDARCELSEISGFVADWNSCFPYSYKPPLFWDTPAFVSRYETTNEKCLLLQLYNQALNFIRKVPESNKLRMFAESSITRKLKVCMEEHDWESIKSKLDYEDPIQKAREELDHWSLFFGPDAYHSRKFPHVLRTKEFCERFDAWRELTTPESWKKNSKLSSKDLHEILSKISSLLKIDSPHPSEKDTSTVSSGESPFK